MYPLELGSQIQHNFVTEWSTLVNTKTVRNVWPSVRTANRWHCLHNESAEVFWVSYFVFNRLLEALIYHSVLLMMDEVNTASEFSVQERGNKMAEVFLSKQVLLTNDVRV